MINFNFNGVNIPQQRICKNITPEVEVSPPLGTPAYKEWKEKQDKKLQDSLPAPVAKEEKK